MESGITDQLIAASNVTAGTKKIGDAMTQGLFLRITPDSKIWNMRFTFNGKREQRSLGRYPQVSIAEARDKARAITQQSKNGRNVIAEERQAQRDALSKEDAAKALTFGYVASEWLARDEKLAGKAKLSAKTIAKRRAYIETHLAPLALRPMAEITRAEVRKLLQAIESVGNRNETARRCGQLVHSIFEYALDNHDEHVKQNPAASRKSWLGTKDEEHRAGLTDPKQFGMLMSLLDTGWAGTRGPTVQNALRFLARTFVRQEALCGAQWSEMHSLTDSDNAEWRIPAARMKGPIGKRRPFTVPLSRQAVEILKEQKKVSAHSPFVFPHAVRAARGMSKGAMKAAIGSMGYTPEQHTPHGFRTTFETLAQERPISASVDIVRRCMAHKIPDAVRAAYDRSDRYEERRELMQQWADYIEALKAKA